MVKQNVLSFYTGILQATLESSTSDTSDRGGVDETGELETKSETEA